MPGGQAATPPIPATAWTTATANDLPTTPPLIAYLEGPVFTGIPGLPLQIGFHVGNLRAIPEPTSLGLGLSAGFFLLPRLVTRQPYSHDNARCRQ